MNTVRTESIDTVRAGPGQLWGRTPSVTQRLSRVPRLSAVIAIPDDSRSHIGCASTEDRFTWWLAKCCCRNAACVSRGLCAVFETAYETHPRYALIQIRRSSTVLFLFSVWPQTALKTLPYPNCAAFFSRPCPSRVLPHSVNEPLNVFQESRIFLALQGSCICSHEHVSDSDSWSVHRILIQTAWSVLPTQAVHVITIHSD
jgi:hypothetical protein